MHLARPHYRRGLLLAALALAGIVVASAFGPGEQASLLKSSAPEITAALGGSLVFVVAGVLAVRAVARGVRELTQEHLGQTKSGPVAIGVLVVGYLLVLLGALGSLHWLTALRPLLVGGAVTGVVIGIAAQQTLSNFFAGVVLLVVRPFRVGEKVVVRSGALGGEYEGVVTDMGLFYVTMTTDRGHLELPNAGVLAAAVGPGARSLQPGQKVDDEAGDRASQPKK